jgi:hypothetical protein
MPNYKAVHLVDFCGLQENAFWIQQHIPVKRTVFPFLFGAKH